MYYSQYQEPEVAEHAESVTTLVPSRFKIAIEYPSILSKTVIAGENALSRVSQFPEMVIQVGNKSRELNIQKFGDYEWNGRAR